MNCKQFKNYKKVGQKREFADNPGSNDFLKFGELNQSSNKKLSETRSSALETLILLIAVSATLFFVIYIFAL